VVPPRDYLPRIRELCDRYDIVLIYDEIITGFGRTGTMFAAELWDTWPDIFCLGKGMSGGYAPLSANVLRKQLSPVLARYDFILVDTPAGLCRSTQIGVDAADQVVIVISCGRYALQGTVSMIDWIGEICAKLCKRMPAVKVLLNNFNERRRFDREFKQEVEYIFGDDLYQTQIRPSIRIVEAAAQGLSVIEYTQLSPGVTDFKRLSREMLGLPISVAMPANVMAEHEPQQKKGVLQFIS